jgi:[ribosomal protein S18]-alanine N-acetyltransferase
MHMVTTRGRTVLSWLHMKKMKFWVVIINETNMRGIFLKIFWCILPYMPKTRGKGVGKELMRRVIEETEGDIALHVEPDNPAKFLYEKFGLPTNISK